MVLQCLTWIPHLWGQLVGQFVVGNRGVSPLPDDIIIDILSRLPADCVLKCRRVCRQWRTLTSTPYFAELHLKRVAPTMFFQCNDFGLMSDHELDFFIFDEEAEKDDTRITKIRMSSAHIMKNHYPRLIGSCNGLLLFQSQVVLAILFIFNPITRQHIIQRSLVHISISNPITQQQITQIGSLCGIFFRPLTCEYKLLCVLWKGNRFQYYTRSLGAKMWSELTSLSYRPTLRAPPTIVNQALHWMAKREHVNEFDIHSCANAIIAFSIESEYIHAMPHPGNKCHSRKSHEMMHLLEMKEHLSLCHFDMYSDLIDIWVLEDYANWAWVKRYVVNLDWDVKRFPFEIPDPYYLRPGIFPLNIQNGELLLAWHMRGLFWYHLELNTVRKIGRMGMKMIGFYYYKCITTAYTKTLVSLSDVHSESLT